MTYDPIDTNNDGVVDADVDSQTVDANSINTGCDISIEKVRLGSGGQHGINNRLRGGYISRIGGFGREGGRILSDDLTSIEINTTGSFEEGLTVAELWARDYS